MQIDFSTFMMSLASSAYCSLGLTPNPLTKKTEKNLVSAKQQIDLLEMLKEKTKGNLSKDEETLMESVLYQLHMSYVQVAKNSGTENECCHEDTGCHCGGDDCDK
ncbi:MAG: DUF1844 domain-containing protein [Oligoflexia bacterium]|nr:DUF1844 domain-containing protein [Oligoflexia bacterium]